MTAPETKQCPFCGSSNTKPLGGKTLCFDCGRIGEVMTYRFYGNLSDAALTLGAIARAQAAEAEIARLTAERDAALAGRVRVKPLVWVKTREGYHWGYEAYCGLMAGYYYASTDAQKREHEAVRAARILATLEPQPITALEDRDRPILKTGVHHG